MTAWTNVAGCSECGIFDRCRTCEAMFRAFEARPAEPLSLAWGQAQDCPPQAKEVLLVLLKHTDFTSGFTQFDLPRLGREAGLDGASDENAARWTLQRLRELEQAGLLETLPRLDGATELPWVLGWLSRRTKTPEGIVWFRTKTPTSPAVWRNL